MDDAREMLDRTRRIETRLTKLVKALGFDAGGQEAVYDAAQRTLDVPSRHVSLQDCLAQIPQKTTVAVMIKGEFVCEIRKD